MSQRDSAAQGSLPNRIENDPLAHPQEARLSERNHVNGTEYFREGELDTYEELLPRRGQQSSEAASDAETETTPQ